MSAKQAIGWLLIASSAVASVVIFSRGIIERSEVPVSSPDSVPVIVLEPLDSE